ncbi:MAG: GatB/YqeY domain-containing protein [Thermodesulfobacteriota bacterium]|nr:GatB/YqeY domain-containing protein [Thermodesulfobacteriota bacterium]MEE2975428.1 GatB/YqeY domain-containing protein [Thermodesulfobacteriota bacterium]
MIAILREDLKKAITSKDKVATNAIRSVIAAIGNEGKDAENSEEKVIKTINKEIKKRKDAIALYKENNRDDLKDIEEGELKILEKYLPEQMSEEEVKKEVLRIYESMQSAENVNMGILMKESVKQLSGKADNGMISKIAKEIISSK